MMNEEDRIVKERGEAVKDPGNKEAVMEEGEVVKEKATLRTL